MIFVNSWYDVTWYYAQAIANILSRGQILTGARLLTEMHSMNFSGVTGPFQFDANYDRIQVFDLINFPWNNGTFRRLGYFDAQTFEFNFYPGAAALVYPGGASQIARDGISVLDGDSLAPDEDGAVIVLAFIVGGISSWCSLIIGTLWRHTASILLHGLIWMMNALSML
jgi:hypothetical protein